MIAPLNLSQGCLLIFSGLVGGWLAVWCWFTTSYLLFRFIPALRPRIISSADVRNCVVLLAFLRRTFAGAIVGGGKMDDLIASLEVLLASAAGRKSDNE